MIFKNIDREVMCLFTKNDGTQYKIYVLRVKDIKDINFSKPDAPYIVTARALGISTKEFDLWDMTDGIAAAEIVNQQLKVMGNRLNEKRKH